MSFDPFTAAAIADPYPQYHRLRAEDPVHWSEKLRSWAAFRHDDVRLSSDRSKASKFDGPPRPRPRRTHARRAGG